jgi:hypothetical protein
LNWKVLRSVSKGFLAADGVVVMARRNRVIQNMLSLSSTAICQMVTNAT